MAAYLEKQPLPFVMVIDEDREVMKAFAVFNRLSWDAYHRAHPSVFLIDPAGQVRYAFVASPIKLFVGWERCTASCFLPCCVIMKRR